MKVVISCWSLKISLSQRGSGRHRDRIRHEAGNPLPRFAPIDMRLRRPMTTLRLLLVAAAAASALLPSPSPLRSPPTTDAALRVATSGCAGEVRRRVPAVTAVLPPPPPPSARRDGLLARLADGDGWLIALVVFVQMLSNALLTQAGGGCSGVDTERVHDASF